MGAFCELSGYSAFPPTLPWDDTQVLPANSLSLAPYAPRSGFVNRPGPLPRRG
jgi:hypothetical protein